MVKKIELKIDLSHFSSFKISCYIIYTIWRVCLDSKTLCHFGTSVIPVCDWYLLPCL